MNRIRRVKFPPDRPADSIGCLVGAVMLLGLLVAIMASVGR